MNETIISDLSVCQHPSALSRFVERGKWAVIPYETRQFTGKMLFVNPENNAPPLHLPLEKRGWHKIYLATHRSDVPDLIALWQNSAFSVSYLLRIKLTNDPCYHLIMPEVYLQSKEGNWPERRFSHQDLVEVFWRCADLTGQQIELACCRDEEAFRRTAASLAYVRLVPMTDDEIAEHKQLNSGANRRLIGTYDGMFFGNYPWTRDKIREFVEPLAESDFLAVCWSTSRAEAVQYGSKKFPLMSNEPGMGVKPYWNGRDLKRALSAGIDPLAVMAEICREMGLECLGHMRMCQTHLPPHQMFCRPSALWDNPANRCLNENGIPTGQLSLASPEVRHTLTEVLRDQVENYPIDGVHINFNRCYPFVLFEDAAVKEFMAEHGDDPRTLDPRDPRWILHKQRYVSSFISGVRTMLDEVGQKRRRHLKLALHVMADIEHNRFFGLDIPQFIAHGWVDYLCPHPGFSPELANYEDLHPVGAFSVTPERITRYAQLAAGSRTQIFPDIFPRRKPPDEFRKQAMGYYVAGADGLSFHDLYVRLHRKSEWAMLSRLGQKDHLAAWQNRCADFWRKQELISLDGLSMDPRYNPGNNG